MNISAPFIQRPIATALLMVGLLVSGLIAYPLLPVASLPNVNYPTLSITAQLPGADPQTMASTVASPLELQFGEIPGLTQMTSASGLGYAQITLQFDLNRPGGQRYAVGDQRRDGLFTEEHALSAAHPQSQSG
jgi:multidrug efflux pump subunit AcrB